MTDPDQAARIAAMRAKRGQDPVDIAVTAPAPTAAPEVAVAPARTASRGRRPRPAAGARVMATGLTTSAVLGLTAVITAANTTQGAATAAAARLQGLSAERTAAALGIIVMASRPGRVIERLPVDLPRPRERAITSESRCVTVRQTGIPCPCARIIRLADEPCQYR